MDPAHISELLLPFVPPAELAESQLTRISIYIDLLLRWNARINLTSVREPEKIVTRHFGESLFAARHLFPTRAPVPVGIKNGHVGTGVLARPAERSSAVSPESATFHPDLLDLGSGAGFPGLPVKLWSPWLRLTLIESNQKKATFLREVIRALTLTDIDVFSARAQDYPYQARTVTLRAVEHFQASLAVAARLATPNGRLALLIGDSQIETARQFAPSVHWEAPIPIPMSSSRVLLIGSLGQGESGTQAAAGK